MILELQSYVANHFIFTVTLSDRSVTSETEQAAVSCADRAARQHADLGRGGGALGRDARAGAAHGQRDDHLRPGPHRRRTPPRQKQGTCCRCSQS